MQFKSFVRDHQLQQKGTTEDHNDKDESIRKTIRQNQSLKNLCLGWENVRSLSESNTDYYCNKQAHGLNRGLIHECYFILLFEYRQKASHPLPCPITSL